jgi:ribonuclease P protein component
VRNRIKRLLREWFRRVKDNIPALDLIVIVKASIKETISFEEVCKEMDVITRLNVQK